MTPILAALILAQSPTYTLEADGVDAASKARVEKALKQGVKVVTGALGGPFKKPFRVALAPNRAGFDAAANAKWGTPKSEPWMVGAGAHDILVLLSPGAWATDAAEHDPKSDRELQEIVTHELTHVFHGQHCPDPDFQKMYSMGWFIEGLAVHVAKQLTPDRQKRGLEALRMGMAPAGLDEVWSGPTRYFGAGSLVQFVEKEFGRKKLIELMGATSNEEALRKLGTSESSLLDGWKKWALGETKALNRN